MHELRRDRVTGAGFCLCGEWEADGEGWIASYRAHSGAAACDTLSDIERWPGMDTGEEPAGTLFPDVMASEAGRSLMRECARDREAWRRTTRWEAAS